MNQLIKDLAIKAGFDCDVHASGDGNFYGYERWINQDIENLVKLVVDECVKVCQQRVGNSDYNTGRMHCASEIREHFANVEVEKDSGWVYWTN